MTLKDKDDRREFYSKVASEYDKYAEQLGYEAHLRVPTKLLELHGKDGGTLLDLACGTGLGADLFFEAGFDVIGIDYSPGMIEAAQSRPFKQLYCQSIEEELPVPDCSFDIITAIGVWEFIKAPADLLNTIGKKLLSGGLCGITIPKHTPAQEELNIRSYHPEQFSQFINARVFDVVDEIDFYGWESGHLAEALGEVGHPRHRIDYHGFFLKKR